MPVQSKVVEMELKINVENVLSMNGGEGELSYVRNSRPQETGLRFVQHLLEECIWEMKLIPCERFCIADLGCSVGPNTLSVAESISHAVRNKYSSTSMPIPDLHVFFSDLPSNDFNLLLQHIHHTKPKYYAAAVAGSFYRRLFPKSSLHFVHSSSSFHWLSQVRPEIENRNSRCWNGDGVFISKGGAADVAGAYLRQFKEDFGSFLRARGEEVVEGGRMILFTKGREGCDPTEQGSLGLIADTLNTALEDVVALGDHLTDRRTIENFNLPYFSPHVDEVRSEVEKEGSFRVIRIQFMRHELKSEIKSVEDKDGGFGRIAANQTRAVLERLLACHFRGEVVDAVFERFAVRMEEKASSIDARLDGIVALLERTSISTGT